MDQYNAGSVDRWIARLVYWWIPKKVALQIDGSVKR